MPLTRATFLATCAIVLTGIVTTAQACDGLRDKLRAGDPITLGVSPSSAPFSSLENRDATGYIVDICRAAIEQSARLDDLPAPEFNYRQVNGIQQQYEALGQGEIDLVCTPTTQTVKRRGLYDVSFSLPVFITGADFISRSRNQVSDLSDLVGGSVTAVENTTTIAGLRTALASQGLEGQVEVIPVASHAQGIDRVKDNRSVRAHAGDQAILANFLKTNPGLRLSGELKSFEPYALSLARCDQDGLDFLDRGLAWLFRSGDIWPIYNRNFPGNEPGALLIATFIIAGLPD